jgi:type IV pilus assembly protein PilA
MYKQYKKRGFTLIEILVVIGIVAVLAAVVLIAINPARQFKLARDSQRLSNITAILNAIGQVMAENKGRFMCSGTEIIIPTGSTMISSNVGEVNIGSCLAPDYISLLPLDPSRPDAHYAGPSDYITGYSIFKDALGRITVTAEGEISSPISVTR